jgi:hypothetical protein
MAKLKDMFSQAQRAQSGGGMGFLGKNKSDYKPRASAIVVEFPSVTPGGTEAALKAGANGVLFSWDASSSEDLDDIKKEIESGKAINESLVSGLHVTDGWDALDRESLAQLKEYGIQYIVLPLSAPAQLLALETKDLEKVITVPMRSGELYPIIIRSLSSVDGISAVLLDFHLPKDIASLSIEDILQYQAVREAVRYPGLLHVQGDISEADIHTLKTLELQALILSASSTEETTKQIKALGELLAQIYQEEKDASSPTTR